MLTKAFLILYFLLLLPCILGDVGLGRTVGHEARGVGTRNPGERYVVVFDAGSSGTRVHVFRFDDNLDILKINGQLEVSAQVEPGLSAYANDPEKAAASIVPILQKAVNAVPKNSRSQTIIELGATAGLRLIGPKKSDKILQTVRRLFSNSSLLYQNDRVTVISGTQEGTYMWVAMNYLLGNLGKHYSKTVGVIDLGGASVQMAYAVSANAAAKAPRTGEEYISKHHLKGTNYHLYVHSYLRYGKDAARGEILKSTNDTVNYCILSGYKGTYTYNGRTYNARSCSSGSNYDKCRKHVLKAFDVKAKCKARNCTFNGVWNGGGGAGQDKLYLASAFYFAAINGNMMDDKARSIEVTLADLKKVALAVCAVRSQKELKIKYPKLRTSDVPFFCMDLVYQYTLLTDGFGFHDEKKVTIVGDVKYGDFNVQATWPLGSAIETVSGLSSTKPEARKMYQFWSHAEPLTDQNTQSWPLQDQDTTCLVKE